MKIRGLLKWFNDALRPPHVVQGGHSEQRSIDNVDAMTTTSAMGGDPLGQGGPADAPVNWVPSQQDDRPRH
jgi:hypothetical protein